MPDPLKLEDISPDAIEDAERYCTQLLQEAYPSLDLSSGRVIRELVVNTAALLVAGTRQDYDRMRRAMSPLEIIANPELADPEIVDSIYSNYRISRTAGTFARGSVAIIISERTTVAVPVDTVFDANGLQFELERAYVGVTTQDAVVSSGERLIEARPDGTYVFTVPVVAKEPGEEYRLLRGTRLTASPALTAVVDITVASDFEGGSAEETNEELVDRIQAAIAQPSFSGRSNTEAKLREALPLLRAVSQVGFGDSEMVRDRRNIFQWSTGGKADIYVQTASVPTAVRITRECLYDSASGAWQGIIGRDDAPGFYTVSAVVPRGTVEFAGSLPIVSEERGLDLSPETDWVHQVEDLRDGAYSRYQTAIVRFTDTPPENGETAREYDFYLLRLPDIRTLHNLTIDRSERPECADMLIRAAVPAFTSVTLDVKTRSGTAKPDVNAIKRAVAARVNALGFSLGRLPVGLIIDAANSVLERGGTTSVTPIDMTAMIYPPDTVPNERIVLQDIHELVIPNLPERGVSQRTTVFYLPVTSISVSVTPMSALAI